MVVSISMFWSKQNREAGHWGPAALHHGMVPWRRWWNGEADWKKKQLPKREKSQIPLNWWSVAFLSTFFGITIYILYCIYYIHRHSYVLVISKAFWCEPNGIATIPATTVGGSFLFIALLGVYPIPNQNWGLGLFLGFPSFGSRLSRIGVYRSAGVGIPAKLGFEATDPWAQFFSLHWVHLEKHSLMERCRKTYLRCSKTRCVMFFLQFLWETVAHFRNALSLPPVPLFKFPRRSKRKSGPVSGTSSFWSAPNMGKGKQILATTKEQSLLSWMNLQNVKMLRTRKLKRRKLERFSKRKG